MHCTISCILCGLVSQELAPYGYGVFALCVSFALLAVPLVGDLGALLRADPAREWVEALPVRPIELKIARMGLLLTLLWALALASLIPAAFFAPADATLFGRVGLVAGGLLQALFLAGGLLGLQAVLGRRAEGVLVLLQTGLVVGVLVGLIMSLRLVPMLRELREPVDGAFAFLPPGWFATSLADNSTSGWKAAPWLATLCAVAILGFAPPVAAAGANVGRSLLGVVLTPFRVLAARYWVRDNERAGFDLVYDALPLEREFVLRTYPMFGIPLAFLIAGFSGEDSRESLLALILFTPATYLPVLLVHIPVTQSPAAAWIQETAPISPDAIANGALKAVAVRFLLPLYGALAALAWAYAGIEIVLRLALPGALLSLIVLRYIYPRCVEGPPLSTAPDEISGRLGWAGLVGGCAIVLTLLAVLAYGFVVTITQGLIAAALLVAVELVLDRRARVTDPIRSPSRS